MSLKAFHIVFVVASILLAFGFGAWSLVEYDAGRRLGDLIYGVCSTLAGVTLLFYARYVLRKLKHISYL